MSCYLLKLSVLAGLELFQRNVNVNVVIPEHAEMGRPLNNKIEETAFT